MPHLVHRLEDMCVFGDASIDDAIGRWIEVWRKAEWLTTAKFQCLSHICHISE